MRTVSRRDFLGAVAGLAAVSNLPLNAFGQPQPPVASDLLEIGAAEAVTMMTRGDVTAERYATALLARCDAGKALNAFIAIEPDRVMAAARAADRRHASGARLGPLHGLPIPIKGSVNSQELPTTGGTRALRAFRPKANAPRQDHWVPDRHLAQHLSRQHGRGLPGLMLPAGLTPGGLPVSLEFDGPAGSDRALLALGLSLERVFGGIAPPRI